MLALHAMMKADNHPIIFYDGVCGLCNKSVQFLIKRDRMQKLRYAALQSHIASAYLGDNITFDSFILYENGKMYKQSTAALKALAHLGGWWKLSTILFIVPLILRDAVYDFVARKRYKWFGKYDSCKIPTPDQRKLFIDSNQ
jgi:predicted DCC family thiol-disulfide oxidoreductase YuxK